MEGKPISKWIIVSAIFQIVLLIIISIRVASGNGTPSLVGNDEAMLLFGNIAIRHLAIVALILIGLIHKNAAVLFGGFVARFIMDFGDYIWRIIITDTEPKRLIVIFIISAVVLWTPQILSILGLRKHLKKS